MNGVSYPISDQGTGSCSAGRRKLATEVNVSPPVFHGRRKLGFFSALMTSGSFMRAHRATERSCGVARSATGEKVPQIKVCDMRVLCVGLCVCIQGTGCGLWQ